MDSQIIRGACTDVLPQLPAGSSRLIFADPPYNIGLKYDVYQDKKGYSQYCDWLYQWIAQCHRVLTDDGSIYLMMGDEYAAEANLALKRAGFVLRSWVIWHYTFGQNQRRKYARAHAHILYFVKDPKRFVWNLDDIRVPSARTEKYKDKRAHPLGKVPDDVWDFSRVCGTFRERLRKEDGSAHPCQLPEALLTRIVKASSMPGDLIVDPFAGTGTTAAVAHNLGRRFLTTDLSEMYCRLTASRVFNSPERFSDVLTS